MVPTALLLPQPRHFGDYARGGVTLLFAVLGVATIAVLINGLCLWLRRGRDLQKTTR